MLERRSNNHHFLDAPQYATLEALIDKFREALSSRRPSDIYNIWNENLLLREWCSGQEIYFGYSESVDGGQDVKGTISPKYLFRVFRWALGSRYEFIIMKVWDGNPLLFLWYSGKEDNFGSDNFGQPILCSISPDELIQDFELALLSTRKVIIDAIWNCNSLLRARFSGQEVVSHKGQKLPAIPTENLILNFKLALSSRAQSIIRDMWKGNERLHNAIMNLNIKRFTLLVIKVMSSSFGKNKFIVSFINWISKLDVLNAAFKEVKDGNGGKASKNKEWKISLLQSRINVVEADIRNQELILTGEKKGKKRERSQSQVIGAFETRPPPPPQALLNSTTSQYLQEPSFFGNRYSNVQRENTFSQIDGAHVQTNSLPSFQVFLNSSTSQNFQASSFFGSRDSNIQRGNTFPQIDPQVQTNSLPSFQVFLKLCTSQSFQMPPFFGNRYSNNVQRDNAFPFSATLARNRSAINQNFDNEVTNENYNGDTDYSNQTF